MTTTPSDGYSAKRPQIYGWLERPVLGLVAIVVTVGFAQFGVVAALADLAEEFGDATATGELTIAQQAGLSGTQLGVGLAIIRLASAGSLYLAGTADRFGRRRTLLVMVTTGLCLVGLSSFSTAYWMFVAVIAASRPFLSATIAIAGVGAAEQTSKLDRARAMALMTGAYGVGAGIFAVVRGLLAPVVGFRPLFFASFALCGVVVAASRWIRETDRWRIAESNPEETGVGPRRNLWAGLDDRLRRRLVPVLGVMFAIAVITGPANSFVFLYAEKILDIPPAVTAALVTAAGVTGLVGLVLGRWLADHLGRRPTGAVAMAGVALGGMLTYSGPTWAAATGYLAAILAGAAFAPAAAALHNELFPTSVRSAVAGWTTASGVLGAVVGLLAFGAAADGTGSFDLAAMAWQPWRSSSPRVCARGCLRSYPKRGGWNSRNPTTRERWTRSRLPAVAGVATDD